MSALQEVTLQYGCKCAPSWLPESSKNKLRVLDTGGDIADERTEETELSSVPAGLCALESLDIQFTQVSSLPASSTQRLRSLYAAHCDLDVEHCSLPVLETLDLRSSWDACLPPNMGALTSLNVSDLQIEEWSPGWAPASSTQCLRTLKACNSMLGQIPEGMRALESVDVSCCVDLAAEYGCLPAAR